MSKELILLVSNQRFDFPFSLSISLVISLFPSLFPYLSIQGSLDSNVFQSISFLIIFDAHRIPLIAKGSPFGFIFVSFWWDSLIFDSFFTLWHSNISWCDLTYSLLQTGPSQLQEDLALFCREWYIEMTENTRCVHYLWVTITFRPVLWTSLRNTHLAF